MVRMTFRPVKLSTTLRWGITTNWVLPWLCWATWKRDRLVALEAPVEGRVTLVEREMSGRPINWVSNIWKRRALIHLKSSRHSRSCIRGNGWALIAFLPTFSHIRGVLKGCPILKPCWLITTHATPRTPMQKSLESCIPCSGLSFKPNRLKLGKPKDCFNRRWKKIQIRPFLISDWALH